jgi:hypothetical protein
VTVAWPDVSVPTLPRDEVAASRRDVVTLEQEVVADHPRARFVDPLPLLCTDVCSPFHDGRWWYYEPKYLSANGSMRLAPAIDQALRSVLDVSGR